MSDQPLLFTIFLIFTGAAVAATVALYARQALIVAYILLGVLFGPSLLGWVSDARLIQNVADVGILFLLFLLGLNLHPQKLWKLLREVTWVTFTSAACFGVIGVLVIRLFGFAWLEAVVVGATLMFSSTIIGLKLLPTTVLHHQRTGEIMISILLLQDVMAIFLLVSLQAKGGEHTLLIEIALLVAAFIGVSLFAYVAERFILIKLIRRFDKIQEYIFLLAIGWCLGVAGLAKFAGLSHEIGAFIAGIALATNSIALFIAESLKPLRDFFLIIFFFAMGASLDVQSLGEVIVPAVVLAVIILSIKPFVFRLLLMRSGETRERAGEIGVRLGQGSEFALLIAVLALQMGVIGQQTSSVIQVTTLLSFIISTYWIVRRYPTPIATNPKLRRS
jgi:Kef-type K+ transport system membrane component KefB